MARNRRVLKYDAEIKAFVRGRTKSVLMDIAAENDETLSSLIRRILDRSVTRRKAKDIEGPKVAKKEARRQAVEQIEMDIKEGQ